MKNAITIGSQVSFDSEEGIQTGIVADIKHDVGNGCAIALVDVPGTHNGTPWQMPIQSLQRNPS